MTRTYNLFQHKLLSALTVLMILLFSTAAGNLTVHAAKTYEFTLDRQQNIEIIIRYQGNKAPTLSIKGPSSTYSKNTDFEKVEKKEGIENYYIKNAPQGKWTIQSNIAVDFTVLSWAEPIRVTSFSVSQPKNDKVTVKTKVEAAEERSFEWYLYALSDADITGAKEKIELLHSHGTTNKETTAEADISKLPDGNYRFSIEAITDYGGDITSETASSTEKPLQVKGHTKQGDVSQIVTRADAATQTIFVDWSAVEDHYDKMRVSATDKNGELLIYEDFDRNVTNTSFLAESEVTLRLMPLERDTFSVMYTLKFSYTSDVSVTIDTPEVTGDLMVKISYQTNGRTIPADITINGVTNRYRLSGSDSLSLPIEPMTNNEVSVTYYVQDHEQYTVSKTISVQSAPAYIEFYGVTSRLVTDRDTIAISGKTEPDAALKLNGQEVSVGKDGEFTATASLSSGENLLTFTLESPYGIRTERTVTVIRTSSGSSAASVLNRTEIPFWQQLVFDLILLLLTVGFIFLTIRMIRKRKLTFFASIVLSVRMLLLYAVIALTLSGSFCLYQCFRVSSAISGENLIQRLETSDYEGLNHVLTVRDAWILRTVITFVCAAICIILFILLTVFSKKLIDKFQSRTKTPKPKKPKKPKAPKKPRNPLFGSVSYPQNQAYPQNQQPPQE